MTAVLGSLLIGLLAISLLAWRHYGFGRGLVAVLYWLAARFTAAARAVDSARLAYHESLRDPDRPTPEAVVRAVRRLEDL